MSPPETLSFQHRGSCYLSHTENINLTSLWHVTTRNSVISAPGLLLLVTHREHQHNIIETCHYHSACLHALLDHQKTATNEKSGWKESRKLFLNSQCQPPGRCRGTPSACGSGPAPAVITVKDNLFTTTCDPLTNIVHFQKQINVSPGESYSPTKVQQHPCVWNVLLSHSCKINLAPLVSKSFTERKWSWTVA